MLSNKHIYINTILLIHNKWPHTKQFFSEEPRSVLYQVNYSVNRPTDQTVSKTKGGTNWTKPCNYSHYFAQRGKRTSELASICYTEGADFHWRSNNERSFRRVAGCKLLVHEPAVDNWFILEDNFVAVATLEALLITVALMVAVLDLLKVPNDTEFADCSNKVLFLLSVLCHLMKSIECRGTDIRTNLQANDHHNKANSD